MCCVFTNPLGFSYPIDQVKDEPSEMKPNNNNGSNGNSINNERI